MSRMVLSDAGRGPGCVMAKHTWLGMMLCICKCKWCETWHSSVPVWQTVAPAVWSSAFRSLFPAHGSAPSLAGFQCRSSAWDSAFSPTYTPPPSCSTCASADQSVQTEENRRWGILRDRQELVGDWTWQHFSLDCMDIGCCWSLCIFFRCSESGGCGRLFILVIRKWG